MASASGYRCEYCKGTARERHIDREAFKHKSGFVIPEDVIVGVCDRCGNRYYAAETLKRVQAIATGDAPASRAESVPVALVQ